MNAAVLNGWFVCPICGKKVLKIGNTTICKGLEVVCPDRRKGKHKFTIDYESEVYHEVKTEEIK